MKKYLLFLIVLVSFCFNWNIVEAKSIVSREEKEYAGLDYNRHRYYNPETGQYISQDPIGLAGNNPNFYAYVFDSNVEVDPFGLSECEGKFKEVDKQSLPDWIAESFEGGHYKTVITQEDIIVYRVFGGKASSTGGFVTTVSAGNRINAKINAALLPEWKNSKEFEAIINVPKGTTLNIGKVAPQTTMSGTILNDQYLMPQNWPSDWIIKVNPLPSK